MFILLRSCETLFRQPINNHGIALPKNPVNESRKNIFLQILNNLEKSNPKPQISNAKFESGQL